LLASNQHSLTGSLESRPPQTKGTAKRACETQNSEPDGVPDLGSVEGVPDSASSPRSPRAQSRRQSFGGDPSRLRSEGYAELSVPSTHLAFRADGSRSRGSGGSQNNGGSINDRHARVKRTPSQPISPSNAANDEVRDLLVVEPAREGTIVDEPAISLVVFAPGAAPCLLSPVRICQFDQLLYVRVPAAADH